MGTGKLDPSFLQREPVMEPCLDLWKWYEGQGSEKGSTERPDPALINQARHKIQEEAHAPMKHLWRRREAERLVATANYCE